jgi:hypothetical protein
MNTQSKVDLKHNDDESLAKLIAKEFEIGLDAHVLYKRIFCMK